MEKNNKYSPNSPIASRELSEEEIEDVLFTFLGRVNEENFVIAEKRKNKFLEFLSKLGPVEADKFITAIAKDKEESDEVAETSPTVGEVISRFMEIQQISVNDLRIKLGIEATNIKELLNESYRVSEYSLREIAITIAMRHDIKNQLAFRNVLSTGYRFWALKPSPASSVRLAARKKNK